MIRLQSPSLIWFIIIIISNHIWSSILVDRSIFYNNILSRLKSASALIWALVPSFNWGYQYSNKSRGVFEIIFQIRDFIRNSENWRWSWLKNGTALIWPLVPSFNWEYQRSKKSSPVFEVIIISNHIWSSILLVRSIFYNNILSRLKNKSALIWALETNLNHGLQPEN